MTAARPEDTIAAISTAPGRAGIAVVRVSGPRSAEIAAELGFSDLEPRRATYGRLVSPEDGGPVDRVVVTRFAAPASYTGEEMLEIGCHGGSLAPQLVLDAACAAGARPAEAGEFTRRAYLHGKMDLVQVEATQDLVEARSVALHDAALFQLEGGLSRRVEELREALVELEALLAYAIDFPEEDEGPVPPERVLAAARELRDGLDGLLRRAPEGELLREGALTVIAGRPNAGKSSLFNALLGEERAIVTEIPGTTRDAIEAMLSVEGYPFRLVDTAGLRERADRVEELGIEVARGYLERADLVLFCAETGRRPGAEERAFLERWREEAPRLVRVRTKADLAESSEADPTQVPEADPGGEEGGNGWIPVSARTGRGLGAVRRELLERVFAGIRDRAETPLVTRRRHARQLRAAREEVEAFLDARERGLPPEIAATHVQEGARALEELLGVVDVEDVLDAVFGSFCVGK